MASTPEPRPSLDPESEEYQRLWAQGLRPRVIWVPDTKDPEFIARMRREAQEIANSPEEDMDLMDAASPSQSVGKPSATHPPEVVAEWRRVAEEIARSPQEAEDIAWVESVSIFFEEACEAGSDPLT